LAAPPFDGNGKLAVGDGQGNGKGSSLNPEIRLAAAFEISLNSN
jgi:hypothetical protein